MKFTWNMRLKTFLAALVIDVLGIIFISAFFYNHFSEILTREYTTSLYEHICVGSKNADKIFQNVYRIALDISFDNEIRNTIFSDRDDDWRKLSAHLREYKERDELIDGIYCYLPMKNRLVRSEEYNSVQIFDSNAAREWTNLIYKQQGMQPLFAPNILIPSTKNVYLYNILVPDSKNQSVAYITVTISERGLYYAALDDIAGKNDSVVVMFSPQGKIVSGNRILDETTVKELFIQTGKGSYNALEISLNGENYIGTADNAPFSHYTLCLLVNKKEMVEQILIMQVLSVMCVVVILLISTLFLYVFSVKLSEPVENLAETMQKVGTGNFSARAKIYGQDEIGYLADRFNHMLEHIKKLVDDLANEKFLKKQAELNALQYQIRPHFVYNTLNSIRFAALMQGAKNIGDLLAKFIELLQVSTNRKGIFAPLQEEVDTLKNYVALQEFRLPDTFSIEYNLSEESLFCYVPRLILQPFVENSIIHAPSVERSFVNIVIRSYLQTNKLFIEIEDDGKGMSEGKLHSVMTGVDSERKSHGGFSSIGIANVSERLRLYYGSEGGLNCFSDGKTYTRIQICLPVKIHQEQGGISQ